MPLLRLILVALAALLVPAQLATAATPQPRIINGHLPSQEWPAQTFVRHVIGNARTSCGGTLVSARWVLTAGHCVTRSGAVVDPGAFSVWVGGTVGGANPQGFNATVDTVIRHPSFSNGASPNHDVALLRLVQIAPQEPMRLIGTSAAEQALWAPGTTATVLGWGGTNQLSPPTQSTTLLEAQVPIIADATCAGPEPNWGADFDPATMVCAGGTTVDTCSGDSGGPLMVPRLGGFALLGVTSWGNEPCGVANIPGVYASLGDPILDDWVKAYVPTIAFTTAPAVPLAGAPVTFTAAPGPAGGTPSVLWDTDGDGAFDDAAGPSVSMAFPAPGAYNIAVRGDYPEASDRAAIARDAVAVAAPPPPPPPPPPPAPPPFAAKLEILRASVSRADRRLSVLAPITGRASGQVRAALQAAGRSERFGATIDARNRRVRINRAIPAAQANLGTGILTLTYGGDGDTQPQEVRLRAASRPAALEASRPRITNGRLVASGEVSRRARGVVRLQLLFEPAGAPTRTLEYTAPIANGRYRFNVPLPAEVRAGIAQRRGVVHSYTLFTGYFATRIRGEMRSFQVLGAR